MTRYGLVQHLIFLLEHDAPSWRVRGVARALLGKIILQYVAPGTDSLELVKIHDSLSVELSV